ncbi:hypothetical protein EVAR_75537_1 [Eumeta japonica]|uniref:Fibronectin type-III domain-containing protein n=1 Tax=Eumeta variegata TaxID=151549 RepID=A0A4C1UJ08_EUMVA|nr:hypothetical protein EVAR_75537_1 [Eumeta japonica]
MVSDYVEVIGSSLDQLVFNVTCRKCTFSSSNSVEPQAGNLTVTGYAFQLVSVEEAYPPNWDKAITVMVDIVDPANTTFPVGNLSNSTTFHARVQTCNQAGCSDWLDVHPDPKTTDFGVTLTAMPILMLTIGIILLF